MTPVLQTLRRLRVRILLRFALLCEMAPAVTDDLPHVREIVLVVMRRIFLGILFQDLDDLTAAVNDVNKIDQSLRYGDGYLSWPMVSPEPSSLDQPAPADSSEPSQSVSSSGDMLTMSLNSLGVVSRDKKASN